MGTSLAAQQPHPPTAERFADSWYCYLNDPAVGLTKLVFLTYRNEQTDGDGQHAYLHVAHAPLDGPKRLYDHWARDVRSAPVGDPTAGAFRFEVPGLAVVDETTLSLTLPEVEVEATFVGPHRRYFDGPEPTASPFFGPTGSVPEQSHWFVVTLGTPTDYRYRDATATHEGAGPMYVERGWSVSQAHGFCYLMAVSDEASLVLTCGMPDDDTEVWAGRLVTSEHDITFLPFAGDHEVASDVRPDDARAEVTFRRDGLELHVVAEAPLAAFYDQITPSLTVFGADTPVAKTMDADLLIEVRQDGGLVESVRLPQSIFELAGILYPPTLTAQGGAQRPTYRYPD